ncbi:Alpha/Beta hydrolase protein [Podospora fimiseda]|uniref:Alpha/Beta hydrolase protein n=1 Tax=Podospora fimiseda TaxID=252190 RepID=A0AAN7H053_9PEZI|nr:Alpha/Beta hydrolase protein [Podospora fimiseda]
MPEIESSSDAHISQIFYVGGENIKDSHGREVLHGQIYVEHLIPVRTRENRSEPENHQLGQPIIFIPGSGRTSADFLTIGRSTIDNNSLEPDTSKQSWVSFFLSKNQEVYLVDPPFRGRSPFTPNLYYTTFSSSQLSAAWFQSPQIRDDPLTMQQILSSTYPQLTDLAQEQLLSQKGITELLNRINRQTFLLAHSMGAKTAWLVADAKPELVKGIIAVEPAGPLFRGIGVDGLRKDMTRYGITDARITFMPEGRLKLKEVEPEGPKKDRRVSVLLQDEEQGEVTQLVNLKEIPVVVVTSETSVHKGYDWGTVEFLRQAGVKSVDHVELEDVGVEGNGHMMMLEGNRAAVVEVICGWMGRVCRGYQGIYRGVKGTPMMDTDNFVL